MSAARLRIPSDHFAFQEDVARLPGVTACGMTAIPPGDFYEGNVTESWVTDAAEPIDPRDILCDECRAAMRGVS